MATTLTALLEAGGATVFLDAHGLLPGDVWPRVLAQAQARSAVTVILVSKHTSGAYYQLEELAEAIEMARHGKSGHRVVPVYLEPVEQVPFGLRVVQGVWALDPTGVQDTVSHLLRLLPRPGDQPSIKLWSPLVPSVSRFFAGRDELLGRLASQRPKRASVLTQTVVGLGGVGKTTLAAAWCWEQAEMVDIVCWLRAETDTTLIADLADIAARLGLPGSGAEDLAAQAEAACRALENEDRRWLLVFDNAESDAVVDRFTPRRGNGRVIVTTRRRDFGRLGPVIDVDVFDPVTAEAFLRARVDDTNPAAAKEPAAAEVALRLGGLPLALEQSGAYVAYSPRRTFAGYLDCLDDAGLDPFIAGRPLDYRATATTTWQVSIDAASRRAPLAPKVMATFAYLAPAPLPVGCLVAPEVAAHPFLAAATGDVTAAIDELYAYSLLAIDRDTLSVHRVVRDAARWHGDPAASSFVVDALRRFHPQDVERPDRWASCAVLLPHVLTVAATATTDDPDSASKISWLLDRAGSARCYSGASAQAIPILEQAVNLAVELNGADHPESLRNRNDLAFTHLAAGHVTEAVALLETNLADTGRLLGTDHPATLELRNYLAITYGKAGRITEAVALSETNLADRERVLGADHSDTLESRNVLAAAYREAGRFAEAITLYEANLANSGHVLGADHPLTLRSRNRLALAYRCAGRFAEAITIHTANLADRERVLGTDHPDTLQSRQQPRARAPSHHPSQGRTRRQTQLLKIR